jgi:glyoxylase-like metal-dependent hydrolase (beta-lactamase superfamily II)
VVSIAQPEIVFTDALDVQLGDVTCHIRHVGGDHADDSCVMHVLPDRVLFLGDCLYDAIYTPTWRYTAARLFPLLDAVLGFEADHFIQGHADVVLSRAEMESMAEKMRYAGRLVERIGGDERAVFDAARAERPLDEDTEYFLSAFIAGRNFL